MLYEGKNRDYDYFGEWSAEQEKPHGRGIWFGGNTVRVGYFKSGAPTDGKVFCVVGLIDPNGFGPPKYGTLAQIGVEKVNGKKTTLTGTTVNTCSNSCSTGKWINGRRT